MFADKNKKLAMIAGGMLLLAVLILVAGLAYRAGYTSSTETADLPEEPGAAADLPTSVDTAVPATPTDEPTPLPTDEPTQAPTVTPLPPTASPADTVVYAPPPTNTPEPTPTESLGEVRASIAEPTYLAEGRWAEVMLTVSNVSVPEGVATGYTYLTPNPGGGTQYVTIFQAIHDEVPLADIDPDAPMWIGWVTLTDDSRYYFPAGCFYVETVDAEGWEPLGPNGFFWEVHWTGGFFDCGNSTHKIPQTPRIMPGESATIPMYVYIQHPRLWHDENWEAPTRRIAYIGLEVRDGIGRSLGIVAEYLGQ